ncbi:TrmH family RNA methyltransferase [Reichenbachiella versicolor]|uniref:TrmH family RNA methyltransferase n=1 Tax=Reichenbachiella versicolor TaxID=1821036 RepID=UPI001FEA1BA6|nr:RNA methyltransferase [Reichenbachiella versicolor]
MDNLKYDKALYDYLLEFVTPNKLNKFDEILSQRTRCLTPVLEDIFKPHNASAVMRTAECFGLQDVHVIEQDNAFNLNPYVLRGSGKWLSIHHHLMKSGVNNTETCYKELKSKGYQILATSPHDAVDYREVELNDKTAIVFGSEENGISDYARDHADQLIKIPMRGFTESFNISVSAAIVLEHYNHQIRVNKNWQLSKSELFELKMEWMKKVVPNIDIHVKRFEKLSGMTTY